LLAAISSDVGRSMAYVFAANNLSRHAPNHEQKLLSRFFFLKHGSVVEDPGTGSATANLGGWMLGASRALPLTFQIEQGASINRPCNLGLNVDANKQNFVSGRVIELGRGVVHLQSEA